MADQEEEKFFDNGLDFNAWQLQTSYTKDYSDVITKDVALSNLRTKEHFKRGFINLRLATYLNKITRNEFIGYLIKTEQNEEGIEVHNKEWNEALSVISPEDKILSVTKIYQEQKVFPKSVHNKRSTSYVLFTMSRGIMGKASTDLNTVRQEQTRTLKDETERRSFFTKKTKWVDQEKQKNW